VTEILDLLETNKSFLLLSVPSLLHSWKAMWMVSWRRGCDSYGALGGVSFIKGRSRSCSLGLKAPRGTAIIIHNLEMGEGSGRGRALEGVQRNQGQKVEGVQSSAPATADFQMPSPARDLGVLEGSRKETTRDIRKRRYKYRPH